MHNFRVQLTNVSVKGNEDGDMDFEISKAESKWWRVSAKTPESAMKKALKEFKENTGFNVCECDYTVEDA